jgi:hypothetical protein
MRFLLRVVSEVAGTAKDFIEIVVAGVVGIVLFLATVALRLLVYLITMTIVVTLLNWVYGLIFHRPLFF